ncbi:class I SAM-dependent methyltransferase [Ramlibacter sp.]|uniref:class I SAM-dependent methyltransferase n=1 Tax=Ramlibacter sp. TaxID=1917967 RepID=UPI0018377909|nr:class I SAM-dependent methyltransferase [Ramlibacter sp.]MBA2674886.1 class I SAM-dependent methyltransferase [Ramlibacter sp.]
MLRQLRAGWRRLVGGESGSESGDGAARTAQHWDNWQARVAQQPARYGDWADHPVILGLLQEELFGSPSVSVLDFFKASCPAFESAHALSLCCGDGAFERQLVAAGVFGSVTGMDLSPARVEAANAARGEWAGRLAYEMGDANSGAFGTACYDVVFAKAALHHVEALEAMFAGVRRCLRPGGRLAAIDFFGPTRFQWTDRQLALANAFLQRLPDALVRRPDGSLHRNLQRPTVAHMIALDPSEAVRSGELLDALRASMRTEHELDAGGAVLNLVFDGAIVNNFEAGRPEHDAWIHEAFACERAHMAAGDIGSDFKVIVARPA